MTGHAMAAVGIKTKYLGATDTRGSRIKVSAECFGSKCYSYEYEKSALDTHYSAARDFVDKVFNQSHFRLAYSGRFIDVETGYIFVYDKVSVNT